MTRFVITAVAAGAGVFIWKSFGFATAVIVLLSVIIGQVAAPRKDPTMSTTSDWPVRRMRNGEALVVSSDRTVVSRVFQTEEGWATERLGLDVDPTDGMVLVARNAEGVITKTRPSESDEWLLSAEWDTESRTGHNYYDDAVDAAKNRTDP